MSELDPMAPIRNYGERMRPEQPDEKPAGQAVLLASVVAALPELQRCGVRRLTVGQLTVELDRVQIGDTAPGGVAGDDAEPADTLPPQPEPGQSDDLDLAAVDG